MPPLRAWNGRRETGLQNPQAKRMEGQGRSCAKQAEGARNRRVDALEGQTLQEAPERCASRQNPVLGNPPDFLCAGLVELRGIEPLTSAVRLQRSPI